MRYGIPDQQLRAFIKKVSTVNKRLNRVDMPGLKVNEEKLETVVYKPGLLTLVHHLTVDMSVAVSGWKIVGIVTRKGKINHVQVIPGEDEQLECYRETSLSCEHCGRVRSRNQIFLLKNPADNAILKVGRGCLSDIFGVAGIEAERYARKAEYVIALGEEARALETLSSWWPQQGPLRLVLSNFLEWVHMCIREHGYITHDLALAKGETATSDCALEKMRGYAVQSSNDVPEEQDKEATREALAWIRSAEDETRRYGQALRKLCSGDLLRGQDVPLAASLFIAREKALEWSTISFRSNGEPGVEKKGASLTSGERVELELIVEETSVHQTRFGVQQKYDMEDGQGNSYVWFTSEQRPLRTGGRYLLSCRVRGQDSRGVGGALRTILTRCKLVRVLSDPPQEERLTGGEGSYLAVLDAFLRKDDFARYVLLNTRRAARGERTLSLDLYPDFWSVVPSGERGGLVVPLPVLTEQQIHELGGLDGHSDDLLEAAQRTSWWLVVAKRFEAQAIQACLVTSTAP